MIEPPLLASATFVPCWLPRSGFGCLRRSRFVSIGMAGGGVILGAALLAMLISTPSAPFGVVLALLALLLGIGGGIWVRRQAARVPIGEGLHRHEGA